MLACFSTYQSEPTFALLYLSWQKNAYFHKYCDHINSGFKEFEKLKTESVDINDYNLL
jgi:hypothetical protein